uniref:26S proteasome regulatory complex ATPase RPT4 n=1 Tax=Glossina morsitans morsitans TaxID=37546 RepID=D3TPB1_GLOMM
MTSLFYSEPEFVIALHKLIIFVNPNDLQIFKEITVPDDLTKCGEVKFVISQMEDEGDEDSKQQQQQQNLSKESPIIQHVKLSSNSQMLAVTTSGQKALLLYKLRPEHGKLVSIRSLTRASSSLVFSKNGKRLLVTDKTGDCYEYDCEDMEAKPKLLLGHLSIVYDVLWSADEKYIITCDRDDKIRVSHYPNTHDIHGYCLGHKEFVSALGFLNNDILISVSGDKSLRLWDFKESKQLKKLDLPAPGLKFSLRLSETDKYQLAVLLYQPNKCVALYEMYRSREEWEFSDCQLLNFPDIIGYNLCFAGERLYVAGAVNQRLSLQVDANSPSTPKYWLQMVEDQFKDFEWQPEDKSSWFKKKYDNVSDYLERKQRRIEEKKN